MISFKRVAGSAILISFCVGLTAAFISTEATNPKIISSLAPMQDSYLIHPNDHIANTPRPIDNYPYPIKMDDIGPITPLFSGSLQYPFICMTEDSGFGQPIVDNQNGWGMPVFREGSDREKRGNIIGYSKDCSIQTGLQYHIIKENNQIELYTDQIIGEKDQLIRTEYGVIHRYIYLISMPITPSEIGSRLAKSQWNNKLIYQFTGGAGIGFRQGSMKPEKLIERRVEQLKSGYAVVTSGANRTSYTYNMLLSEDTARRLKKHFISLYQEPSYTVGVGGSGGGLAQYIMAQNAPGLIDGAIPLYSYPDMVSQTLYALDCDLLNSYYSFNSNDQEYWQNWDNRVHVDGLNAKNAEPHKGAFFQPINQILKAQAPSYPKGNSECINGWFGLYAFIHNPRQGWLRNYVTNELKQHVHWSHWQDLVNVYGKDEHGFARDVWGNEGVQYGLQALKNEQITIEQFIDLNKKVGGWRENHEFEKEKITTIPFSNIKIWLSLWGNHNSTTNSAQSHNGIAPRKPTDKLAVEKAYRYGQVFLGKSDIPILDVRHYLEDNLDMHHVSASFSARLRIKDFNGDYDNQVIWVADENYSPVVQAFETMDTWLLNIKAGKNITQAKPIAATDKCFDAKGNTIAQGSTVWDGDWNQQPNGQCSSQFKIYSNSRIQAGGPWSGAVFECAKVSVESAIKSGIYGKVNISQYKTELDKIFPKGVCDYTKGDAAMPKNLLSKL